MYASKHVPPPAWHAAAATQLELLMHPCARQHPEVRQHASCPQPVKESVGIHKQSQQLERSDECARALHAGQMLTNSRTQTTPMLLLTAHSHTHTHTHASTHTHTLVHQLMHASLAHPSNTKRHAACAPQAGADATHTVSASRTTSRFVTTAGVVWHLCPPLALQSFTTQCTNPHAACDTPQLHKPCTNTTAAHAH